MHMSHIYFLPKLLWKHVKINTVSLSDDDDKELPGEQVGWHMEWAKPV